MINIRPGEQRGQANFGWLDSRHTFSFGNYYDPTHMGFGPLRVINEDRVVGGAGFGTHPHNNMEIISYVISGALEHRDSMGTGSVVQAGDVQRMSAGTGVTHSEFNHSKEDELHFLQIWFMPNEENIEPGYEQKNFTADDKRNQLKLVASNSGRDGSVAMHQDVDIYASILENGTKLVHPLRPNRKAWVQVVKDSNIIVNGEDLRPGDGAAISGVDGITLNGADGAEILLFDMVA